MRHLLRNSIFVLAILVFFAWSIYPPQTKLRLGKDLRGGVTLVYSVQIGDDENAQQTLAKTIEVLKRRVDPEGLMEISMVAQGRDRIEISMPRSNPKVAGLRNAYRAELDKLRASSIDANDFELAMRLDPDARAARLEQLAGGNADMGEALTGAAQAFDEAADARQKYNEARDAGDAQAKIDDLALRTAQAELAYEKARDNALSAAISPEDVDRILHLSNRSRLKKHESTGEMGEVPSPRERAWTALVERNPRWGDQLEKIRQAYQTYERERTTLDDPNDLIRMLQGAGVLDFRITVDPGAHPDEARLRDELRRVGPRNTRAGDAAWYKINDIENWYDSFEQFDYLQANPRAFFSTRGYVGEDYNGEYYLLCWDAPGSRLTKAEGSTWSVSGASEGRDQLNRPAISFRMNAKGAELLRELTSTHQGKKMAILLDDQIYTAPRINSTISAAGIIEGDFSPQELNYIINVLAAGSLQAKLSEQPISVSSVGPDLGHDNLMSGLNAGIWALAAVSVFMVVYYFGYGLVAVVSLFCNALLILGAMSLNRAAFTLPGIAGVILTFGMAVDANVLIYERVREELREGSDLRTSVRLGYQRALSSIVDGNVTNLIVCFVLAYFGTQEIKGFAITLGIGVVATLFSALIISRIIFALFVDTIGIRRMSMLPMIIKPLERLLEPKINWMALRYVFIVLSGSAITLGLVMVFGYGSNMLDIEFRGGTQVTLRFADADGNPITMTRAEVENRVKEIAADVPDTDPLHDLNNPTILPINPAEDGVTSDEFNIKTIATDQRAVERALSTAFRDEMPELEPLTFAGATLSADEAPPAYPIIQREASGAVPLGPSINRLDVRNDVEAYFGGAAIVLDDISPPASVESLQQRIDRMAEKMAALPEYASLSLLGRVREVVAIKGTPDAATAAVVLVRDPTLTYFDNQDRFDDEVLDSEWTIAHDALTEATGLASVQSFSPAIASTFKAQAIGSIFISFLLIMIYIYVRFGSVRYSLAAISCLFHDVLAVIGLIALADYLYANDSSIANALMILPFKIDLNLVAAVLTIIGYSLNDTIIIMDRIRENRGKLPYASRTVINDAINQTISRTVITSGTTFIATIILYVDGGEGVRAFSYALLMGIIVGTYSSIAVAAPLVWVRKADRTLRDAETGVTI